MTTKTIMLPATIKFDGQLCHDSCHHLGYVKTGYYAGYDIYTLRCLCFKCKLVANGLNETLRCAQCIEKAGLE